MHITQTFGDYDDWRVPTIKEMYSLIDFNGVTGNTDETDSTPYIDTDYFDMEYYSSGDRFIDCQYLTTAAYVSTVMGGSECFFGVNFADGRIKCYPQSYDDGYNLRVVRGDATLENSFVDNGDDTVTDEATGLMWLKYDSGYYDAGSYSNGSMDWEEALEWCSTLIEADYDDWVLPDAKQMQSIVDYSRSPATSGTPAIDVDYFETSSITDPEGELNYPYFWTSTSHLDGVPQGKYAVYIAFGEAQVT